MSNNNKNRRPNRKQQPQKLTLWQKILKTFGLYKAPKATGKPARKSNTRGNATPKNKRKHQPVPVETVRLYVGNLSYDATEQDLKDLFKGVGTVKSADIIYNRHTQRSRGYGFVQMLSVDEAKRAVEVLHDQPFMGRNMIVNGSKAKKPSDRN